MTVQWNAPAKFDRRTLPRRARLRLRLTGWVDNTGYWLVCHDHCGAAIRLWKITRLWQ